LPWGQVAPDCTDRLFKRLNEVFVARSKKPTDFIVRFPLVWKMINYGEEYGC
jgi:hypothetical protein